MDEYLGHGQLADLTMKLDKGKAIKVCTASSDSY